MKRFLLLVGISTVLLFGEKPYFQQHVSYTINVKLNDINHTLSAFEKLVYTNHSPDTLNFIWFHLWPNAYKDNTSAFAKQKYENNSTWFYYSSDKDRGYIDSLDFQGDGQPLKWEFHPDWNDVAKVHLSAPLAPGDSVTITTPFFVKVPLVFSRLGHSGKHYEITQWYPKPAVYDRYGWHEMPYLNMGEFYSEFGKFDVTITLPKDYRVMATGDLVDGESEYAWLDSLSQVSDSLFALSKKDFKKAMKSRQGWTFKDLDNRKWKTLHFHQEKVHDFAWFADPKWLVREGTLWLADSTRKVTLFSMFLPKNAKLWENSVQYIHDAGYWYSKFYGDYPYNYITAVDGDMSAGGGMEYPNITVISSGGSKDLLEYVIMHEVGHNWVYGILGSNERDHAWMDEGLNDYTNIRYWEKNHPDRNRAIFFGEKWQKKFHVADHLRIDWAMSYMGYVSRALTGDDQPIELTSAKFNRGNYGSIIYGKTGIFSRYFQELEGEDVINDIYHDYYETWKFKHPYPEDFKAIVRKHVPNGADWYLEDVFNTTETVDYEVELDKGKVEVENEGNLPVPIPMVSYDASGKVLENKILPGFTGEKTFDVPNGTKSVALDPAQRIPDLNLNNNFTHHPLNFKFVFDQPDYSKQTVYWIPWLFNYNTYNGLPIGVMLYSGMIPGFPYGVSVTPLWDFNNQAPAGFATIRNTWYNIFGFKSVRGSISADQYAGHSGANLGVHAVYRGSIKSSPSTTIDANLFYHSLKSEAFNPVLYDSTSTDFAVLRGKATYYNRLNPFNQITAVAGIEGSVSGGNFWKVSLSTDGWHKWNRTLTTTWRIWAGSFLSNTDVPTQYLTFFGGGVDPDFENRFVFDRMNGNDASRYNLLDEQYLSDGPGLHGLAFDASNKPIANKDAAFGINLQQSIPKVPIDVFVDGAGGSNLTGMTDAGFILKMSLLSIYVPVYQSWDADPIAKDGQALLGRLRFSIKAPSIRLGR